jgi:hypothetical protein|tara:strand:- start:30 stop:581 length:552 start_codon:yes stop_codon:yes gene_type:complete
MKKLIIIFSLITSSVVGQVHINETVKNITIDKNLSIEFFKSCNKYRTSINKQAWNWSDSSYNTSLNWNNYLAKNNIWTHSNKDNFTSEIIVSVNLTENQDLDYQFIIDSCISQIINSPYHKGGFCAPKRTKQLQYAEIDWAGVLLHQALCDSGACSAIIIDYGHYKRVSIILHTIRTIQYNSK